MSDKKTAVYVGCSLTQATEVFKADVEALKDAIRKLGYEVFDFVGTVNGTSKEVYEWDLNHCVGECDILIGICDHPSIGLGWELGVAIGLKKTVLAVAHADAKVTRLVLGAAEVEPNMRFERYNDLLKDVPPLLEAIQKERLAK
jgi:nucleoside 2-deoxyribosyltransferase